MPQKCIMWQGVDTISSLHHCMLFYLNVKRLLPRITQCWNSRELFWWKTSDNDVPFQEDERVNWTQTRLFIYFQFWILTEGKKSFRFYSSRTKFCELQYLDWNYKKFLIINSIICFLVYILFVSFSLSVSSIKCQV